MVVDPTAFDDKALFAMDQYLMRGGTVVVATGAYRPVMQPPNLSAMPAVSGVGEWLTHHGVTVDSSFVLDPKNAAFPVPVVRDVGPFQFQDVQMVDYPYFIDVRDDALNQDVPFTAAVPQLTMAWTSPVDVDAERNAERSVTPLLRSSPESWRSTSLDIVPTYDPSGEVVYVPEGPQQAETLAVMVEGRFDSFFDTSPLAEEPAEEPVEPGADSEDEEAVGDEPEDADTLGTVTSVIERSPESARLIVLGSGTFVADQTVRMIGSADGMVYANSVAAHGQPGRLGGGGPIAARHSRPRPLQPHPRTDGHGRAAGLGIRQLRAGVGRSRRGVRHQPPETALPPRRLPETVGGFVMNDMAGIINRTTLAALLAVQVVVVGVLIAARSGGIEEPAPFLVYDPDLVDGISVSNSDGSVALAKVDGIWQLDSGIPAARDKAESMTSRLSKSPPGWPVANTGASRERFEVTEDNHQRPHRAEHRRRNRGRHLSRHVAGLPGERTPAATATTTSTPSSSRTGRPGSRSRTGWIARRCDRRAN